MLFSFFCTVAVPKLDSVVGEEVHLKLLLAKRNSPMQLCCLALFINYAIGPSTFEKPNIHVAAIITYQIWVKKLSSRLHHLDLKF